MYVQLYSTYNYVIGYEGNWYFCYSIYKAKSSFKCSLFYCLVQEANRFCYVGNTLISLLVAVVGRETRWKESLVKCLQVISKFCTTIIIHDIHNLRSRVYRLASLTTREIIVFALTGFVDRELRIVIIVIVYVLVHNLLMTCKHFTFRLVSLPTTATLNNSFQRTESLAHETRCCLVN